MSQVRRLLLPIVALLFLVACFDVSQTIQLDKDLSGSARIVMTVDMEPMVYMMASMKRGFEGKEGAPTEEELVIAREEFGARQAAEKADQLEEQRAKIESSLPEGVTLIDAKMLDGEKLGGDFTFAFDHISKLKEIQMPDDSGGDSDSPFAQLAVEEKDGTLLISTPPINPAENLDQMNFGDSEEDDAGSDMVKQSIESMRVQFELSAPFEVLEHNATEVDGKTLRWEYDFESLTSMVEDGAAVEIVRVLYKL